MAGLVVSGCTAHYSAVANPAANLAEVTKRCDKFADDSSTAASFWMFTGISGQVLSYLMVPAGTVGVLKTNNDWGKAGFVVLGTTGALVGLLSSSAYKSSQHHDGAAELALAGLDTNDALKIQHGCLDAERVLRSRRLQVVAVVEKAPPPPALPAPAPGAAPAAPAPAPAAPAPPAPAPVAPTPSAAPPPPPPPQAPPSG